MYRFLFAIILISFFSPVEASMFIRSESGQWFYFEDTPSLDYFNFTSLEEGNLFKYAPTAPTEATPDSIAYKTEVRLDSMGSPHLWAVNDSVALEVAKLTPEGVEYFKVFDSSRIFKAKANKQELKELPNGNFILWDPVNKKKLFNLRPSGVKKFQANPELLNEIMSIEP